MPPQTVLSFNNQRLQPALGYPYATSNGKFGASTVFPAGCVLGRKTSGGLLFPSVALNAVYTFAQTGTSTAGTVTLSVRKVDGSIGTTTALAYNVSVATLQTALDIASGVVNGVVATSAGNAAPFSNPAVLTFTYSGTGFAALQQPAPTADFSLLTSTTALAATAVVPNRVQTVTVNIAATAGGFNLGITRPTGVVGYTGVVAYNASLATWQTALDLASGVANGVVGTSAGSAAPFSSATALILTFSGTGYAGLPQPLVYFNIGADVTGTTRVTVDDTTVTEDGSEIAVGFNEFGFVTDANSLCYMTTGSATPDINVFGRMSMPFFIKGVFQITDLIGYNGSVLTALNGRLMASGLIYIP